MFSFIRSLFDAIFSRDVAKAERQLSGIRYVPLRDHTAMGSGVVSNTCVVIRVCCKGAYRTRFRSHYMYRRNGNLCRAFLDIQRCFLWLFVFVYVRIKLIERPTVSKLARTALQLTVLCFLAQYIL